MSLYSTDQRCPRCQYPISPGAQTCPNCGMALTSASSSPYGAEYPPPPPPPYSSPQPSSSPYGPPPGTGPYGGNSSYGAPTSYDYTPAPPPPPAGGPTAYYPGSQPQPGFGGTAPAYAGSQPQPGIPFPPGSQPPQPQKSGSGTRIAIIALVVVVILAGAGTAIYLLTRPKPTINVVSSYKVGSTPAGAAGTTLSVTGQKFSGSSNVTFLVDNQPAPDNQPTLSDSNGNIKTELKITSNWGVGTHTLTAKDAGNYSTQQGVTISIVNPGEAKTPGPNGAPSDDASFKVSVHVTPGGGVDPFEDHVTVTGTADAGKQVCNPDFDDGAPHSVSGDASGLTYVETRIYSCSGTYKGGKLSYTENATKDQIVFSNGVTCTAQVPYVFEKLDGTFTDAKTLSGNYSADAVTYSCSNGNSDQLDPLTGTWTGSI